MTSLPPVAGPIAYLTGEYPKISHTFIQREITALRAQGVDVLACTVRRPNARDVVGDDQNEEAGRTFCLIDSGLRAPHRLLWDHLTLLWRSPRRWLSAAALAWRTASPGAKASLWQLFYFLEAGLLARHMQRQGAVHLHNHFGNSSCTVAMLASHLSGIPYSFTLHGPAIFYEPMRWRLDEKIARAAFVACISNFSRSQAMYFSDQQHWKRLPIVHCGIIPEGYGTKPRNGFGKRVIFVGRLDPVKGVPLLLEAFDRLRAVHPEATLDIIGDGPARASLEAQASLMGDAVRFLGSQPQDQVADRLEGADMLVLPSFAEGVPVVLMEAMASRLPVIASQVAGVGELVEDGVSGFLIPPGDTDTLTNRLDRLLGDPELCASMGQKGRAKVEAEFDLNRETAWLGQLFAGIGRDQIRPDDTDRPASAS